MKPHNSIDVANELLKLAWAKGKSLTPMQLLKLVFLCQGWMLGLYGRRIMFDHVEAWKYGPVIPHLYQAIKKFRGSPVTELIKGGTRNPFDVEERSIIRQVFENYGDMSGPALSTLTHAPGSPWDLIWRENSRAALIPYPLIRDFYSLKARTA